jgi:ankyrin repeat protein
MTPRGPGMMAKYEHELAALDGLGLDDIRMDAALTHLLSFVQAWAQAAADAKATRRESAMDDERWWAAHAPLLQKVLDPADYPLAARVGTAAGTAHRAAHNPSMPTTSGCRRSSAASPRSSAAARREGGAYRIEPLFYLAYARHDPASEADAVTGAARLLLDAGGDPNAGYLWQGMPYPFTVLTGVFGEGDLGPVRQPRHPHSLALARVLLEAGADPNHAQALYNRMFEPGNDHLELLFEFGLGTGDGGPWRKRLGDAVDAPSELVRGQLHWAITHGMAARVRLLVTHGADLTSPFDDGSTVAELAATTGHPHLIDDLVAHGASRPSLGPADAFITAVLAADRVVVGQLRLNHPGLVDEIRATRPALVTWAAACGRPGAVELLVELGFDVNAKGRTDVPSDQPWQTALHRAAESGDLELARTLLRLGADPDIRDQRFGSTPLGWARYFGQDALIELLEPVTTPPEDG